MKEPELPLFETGGSGRDPGEAERSPETGVSPDAPPPSPHAPLAERMRPRVLEEVVGQERLLGPSGTLTRLIRAGHLPSLILHGPPGSGKTTIARLLARQAQSSFVPFSAVSEGVPRLREVVREADARRAAGRRTLLFVDEIHRLNKGQQDFLLPYVESGLVTLVGATTEHPGFEINAALLSRATVLVLEPLRKEALATLVERALADAERGLGALEVTLEPKASDLLLWAASGDARQLLTALEIAARLAGSGGVVGEELAREALLQRPVQHDTTRAYELLSAFHKSLRASAPSAALYWAARLIHAGEDPLVIFRRLVAAAYEDVGMADPRAGMVAVQAMQAYERLGAPEGFLPLANGIVYVATAPKSNRAYRALNAALDAAERHPGLAVPLNLRNAPTSLMREWGYGEGYRYAHDYDEGWVEMECLPEELAGARWYEPTDRGYESKLEVRDGGDAEDAEP
jgi:putative ATPase